MQPQKKVVYKSLIAAQNGATRIISSISEPSSPSRKKINKSKVKVRSTVKNRNASKKKS